MTSILSLSRGEDNQFKGRWINFMGVSDLRCQVRGRQAVVRAGHEVRGQENTSNFEGTIEQNAISGTLKGEQGEFKMEGKRARGYRRRRYLEMKVKAAEREFTGTLTIGRDAEAN
jgi:hypothetical protein